MMKHKYLTCLVLTILGMVSVHNVFAQQKDSVYRAEMNLPGVKMVTVLGKYRVWTRKMGQGDIKVLLLHGGPGNTHEYLQSLADTLVKHGVEVYLYDQLGSYFSDQPKVVKGDTIWKMAMRVRELEEVRSALDLDHFYIYGHSFGALLGLAYAAKYPQHLKGLVYAGMNTDFPSFAARYGPYVEHGVDSLMRLDSNGVKILAAKDQHLPYDTMAYRRLDSVILRRTYLARSQVFPPVLAVMYPHDNFTVADEIAGSMFQSPEFKVNLAAIKLPVLIIAGDHDFTGSPADMARIHQKLSNSELYIVPNSGHMSMLDQPALYDNRILSFLRDVQSHRFKP